MDMSTGQLDLLGASDAWMVALVLLRPAGVLADSECARGPPIPDCGCILLVCFPLFAPTTIFFGHGVGQTSAPACVSRAPQSPEALGVTA